MATKNDTPDVNAFVSSFKRKSAPPTIPTPAEPESETVTGADKDATAMEVATETPTAPAPVERPVINQKQTGKKEQQEERLDYASFLEPVRVRKSKAIYVDEDTHSALSVIANAGGGALSDLLINILNHHFETCGTDIRAFLNDQEKLKKKRLPY